MTNAPFNPQSKDGSVDEEVLPYFVPVKVPMVKKKIDQYYTRVSWRIAIDNEDYEVEDPEQQEDDGLTDAERKLALKLKRMSINVNEEDEKGNGDMDNE